MYVIFQIRDLQCVSAGACPVCCEDPGLCEPITTSYSRIGWTLHCRKGELIDLSTLAAYSLAENTALFWPLRFQTLTKLKCDIPTNKVKNINKIPCCNYSHMPYHQDFWKFLYFLVLSYFFNRLAQNCVNLVKDNFSSLS